MDQMFLPGMNLRKALKRAIQAGLRIRKPRRTGELVVEDPLTRERVRINARRKDAPRQLTWFLEKYCRLSTNN